MSHSITRSFRLLLLISGLQLHGCCVFAQEPWSRFTIDNSLRGADGVKLADFNGDGLLDIVTGWEESGRTKIYSHPGPAAVQQPWPSQVLGESPNCEDATWVDLDGDGRLDVLACCEGQEQSLRVFISSQETQWRLSVLPASKNVTRWMFATPLVSDDTREQDDREFPIPDIVVGSKNPHGQVSLLRTSNSADFAKWELQHLANASWIMSLVVGHIDEDEQLDILYTDRKSEASGIYWLKNPGLGNKSWTKCLIGALGEEVMFVATVPPVHRRSNLLQEFYVGAKPNLVFHFRRQESEGNEWFQERIELDMSQAGHMKGLAVADLDEDGELEFVVSCESAKAPKSGVLVFRQQAGNWTPQSISGPEGIKFDLLELVDIDRDGDLDILTCEERAGGSGLGVIWYANPLR